MERGKERERERGGERERERVRLERDGKRERGRERERGTKTPDAAEELGQCRLPWRRPSTAGKGTPGFEPGTC